MNLRKIIVLVFLVFFSVSGGYAQKWKLRRYEAIAGIGTAHYFGDIGGTADKNNLFGIKDIELFNTRPSFYLGARYRIRNNMSVKANFIFGFLKGDDAGSKNNERNLAFTSKIFEPSAQFEFSIISEEQKYRTNAMFNKRGMINNYSHYNIYAFAGIGGVFGWPKPLKDLEGRYEPKTEFGLAFPIGLGVKYVMSSNLSIGVEFGGRLTTEDFLDGYSHPKYSHANDVYYFAVFNAIYRLKTSRRGFPILGKRRASFV
jgi:opacity protein-like surface antigen